MGPTADEIFNGIYTLNFLGTIFVIASAAVWLYDKLKNARKKQAKARAAKRKAEWAAEIERAGIRLMNGTAKYHKSKPMESGNCKTAPIRKSCGLFSVEGQKYIER